MADKSQPAKGLSKVQTERAERLAAALRANLKRRKAAATQPGKPKTKPLP